MNATRLVAAVAVSAGVHVGVAFVGWSPVPRVADVSQEAGSVPASATGHPSPMRVRIAALAPRRQATASGGSGRPDVADFAVEPRPDANIASATQKTIGDQARAYRAPVHATASIAAAAAHRREAASATTPGSDPAEVQSALTASPTPVSYPIFTLPPNDDPRRIGLTRLMLVVSSQGETVDVIVTASTMSQDYVDRVVQAFQAMRFNPARVRGLPYPGYYEVVVNFEFQPPGSPSL